MKNISIAKFVRFCWRCRSSLSASFGNIGARRRSPMPTPVDTRLGEGDFPGRSRASSGRVRVPPAGERPGCLRGPGGIGEHRRAQIGRAVLSLPRRSGGPAVDLAAPPGGRPGRSGTPAGRRYGSGRSGHWGGRPGQPPHVEVRIFNPFSRKTGRTSQYVTRMGSVSRRMHDKSLHGRQSGDHPGRPQHRRRIL